MSARAIAAAIAALAVAWPLSEAALAGPDAPEAPAEIAVGDGHKVFLVAHATGVQIYSCNGTAWVLVAPRANLYGANGKLLGTHYGGPTWEARDGSKVVGRLDSRVTVDPTAIPWLRLVAASASAGPEGGRLEGTTFIQRTATVGGLAPAAGACTAATAGTVQEVDYTANYHFWKQTGG
jgi:FtsP/CotA-like multicopper oxidase with cupredoxin domain